jgi:hypothetical protein
VAEEEVAPDGHEGLHGEVLVDDGDARVARIVRRREADRLAADVEAARLGALEPGEGLDEG